MNAYVGITDGDWYRFLRARPDLDEVNFWRPGGRVNFRAIEPGNPFLFKLRSPNNFIVGGGFFAHSTLLPIGLAWETFEEKNGAPDFGEMRRCIENIRGPSLGEDYRIGCILLQLPFFFEEGDWIPVPPDWSPGIQRGKTYDLTSGHGKAMWDAVQARLSNRVVAAGRNHVHILQTAAAGRYGTPYLASARLGQGSFKILVRDTYQKRCAVTGERTLPVLQAAHIRPYSEGGDHRVDNGLLLREDLHTLFDRGYVTLRPDYRFAVSRRIRDEFTNGREYYALDGKSILLPGEESLRPDPKTLAWHNDTVFKS